MANPRDEAIVVDSSEAYQVDPGLDTSDIQSSTASLTSTVWEYRQLHGRTFNNTSTGGEYWGPNDNQQQDHLDLNHEMLLIAMSNALHFAPLPLSATASLNILDIGTGTGIWAIDFANEHPSSSVIGVDISPIQPSWVPPNCKFEIDDASQLPWTYPDNHFDYIHLRLMMGAIPDWPALYKEAYRVLKPGGWIEHMDYDPAVYSNDGAHAADSPFNQWGEIFHTAGDKIGRTFDTAARAPGWLKEVGYTNVQGKTLKLPMGSWPADKKLKHVGEFNLVATLAGLEGFALFILTQVHGWSGEEAGGYIERVRRELRGRGRHLYYNAISVFGQKPE